jgi:hypothetical protein
MDEQARDSMLTWEHEGIPPCAWTWSYFRLTFGVEFCMERGADGQQSLLFIAPQQDRAPTLTLGLRYIITPQDEL